MGEGDGQREQGNRSSYLAQIRDILAQKFIANHNPAATPEEKKEEIKHDEKFLKSFDRFVEATSHPDETKRDYPQSAPFILETSNILQRLVTDAGQEIAPSPDMFQNKDVISWESLGGYTDWKTVVLHLTNTSTQKLVFEDYLKSK